MQTIQCPISGAAAAERETHLHDLISSWSQEDGLAAPACLILESHYPDDSLHGLGISGLKGSDRVVALQLDTASKALGFDSNTHALDLYLVRV